MSPVQRLRPRVAKGGVFAICAVPAALAGIAEFASSMSLGQAVTDLAAAAIGMLFCVQFNQSDTDASAPRRLLGFLAVPVVAIVAIAFASDSYLPWAMASVWVLIVALGILAAQAARIVDGVAAAFLACVAIGSAYAVAGPDDDVLLALAVAIPIITSTGIGLLVRSYRRQLVAERAEALAKERASMARELHDVIAHELTGMVVLAQAGAQASEDATRATFTHIEQSGRRALVDVRTMVSTLREAGPDERRVTVGDAEASTTLRSDISEVLERFDASTPAAVDIKVDESLDEANVGPRTHLVALRVLSEALTNIRRHAADATEVSVSVALELPDDMTITVADNGSGAGGLGSGNGIGLNGLEKRVTEVGGAFQAGPRPGHGFELRATLPLGRTEPR